MRYGRPLGGLPMTAYAYATTTIDTWRALDVFPLLAVLVRHISTAQLSALTAARPAAGGAASRTRPFPGPQHHLVAQVRRWERRLSEPMGE